MLKCMDYIALSAALEPIAREAGAFIRGSNDRAATQKSNAKDFVTIADIKSQDLIAKRLQQKFTAEVVLSEEHSEELRKQLFAPDFTGFVLDPIDGTYNFRRDMRESAVSIGYIERGQPQVGVVYDPYKDELYAAIKGKGATKNGQPIHVSGQQEVGSASIATSNSYDDAAMARNLKRHLAIYEQTGHMPWTNCLGSGVLLLAYVACGRIDAYHHNGLKPWDNAAAFLIIREAGGKVLTLTGEDAPFTSATVLAGNPAMVVALGKVFAHVPELLK